MMAKRPDRAEMDKLPTPERIDKMRALHKEHMTVMEAAMDKSALDLSTYATTAVPNPVVHTSWTTLNRKMSEGRTTPVANSKIKLPTQTTTYVPPTTTPPVL
jgi:hypothetical protein